MILFDCGDVMHTYDQFVIAGAMIWAVLHGEHGLVPTYWLWLYFLLAQEEKMFTSGRGNELSLFRSGFYHFGPMAYRITS